MFLLLNFFLLKKNDSVDDKLDIRCEIKTNGRMTLRAAFWETDGMMVPCPRMRKPGKEHREEEKESPQEQRCPR